MNNIVYNKEELKEWCDFARAALTGSMANTDLTAYIYSEHTKTACEIADRMMRARFERDASRPHLEDVA